MVGKIGTVTGRFALNIDLADNPVVYKGFQTVVDGRK